MSMLLDPKWQTTALAPLMRLFAGKGYATEQAANTALSALMLPGDVYQGNVSMYGADGRTNPEVINRSADLAGMMTLGSGAIPADPNSLRMGIKAYHGSPHDFDRFDMSKIGTGEGAQAYGRGLYFAENPQTAKNYRDALEYGIEAGGRKYAPAADDMVGRTAMDQLTVDNYNVPATIENIKNEIATAATREDRELWKGALRQVEEWAAQGEIRNPGRMYEVNIDADPNDFLDWDKPLYQQTPRAQDALKSLGVDTAPKGEWSVKETSPGRWTVYNVWGERTGTFKDEAKARALVADNTARHNTGSVELAYNRLGGNSVYSRTGMDAGEASKKLREAGIPGIKYLDAGSRGAGDGSRNYVVFDDKLISIVKKYGVAALVSAGVLSQAQGEEMKAQGYY